MNVCLCSCVSHLYFDRLLWITLLWIAMHCLRPYFQLFWVDMQEWNSSFTGGPHCATQKLYHSVLPLTVLQSSRFSMSSANTQVRVLGTGKGEEEVESCRSTGVSVSRFCPLPGDFGLLLHCRPLWSLIIREIRFSSFLNLCQCGIHRQGLLALLLGFLPLFSPSTESVLSQSKFYGTNKC